jgi:hypothetical protein
MMQVRISEFERHMAVYPVLANETTLKPKLPSVVYP